MGDEARPAGLVRGADARPRCRRGSTRGTAAGRATPGRRGTSRSSRTTGRWPSASGSQIETRRRDRSAATSRRRRRGPGPGRVLDREVVAERTRPSRGSDSIDQVVEREPDRAAPVRVAAEQARRRLAGLVVDLDARSPSTSIWNGAARCRRESARRPCGERNASSDSISPSSRLEVAGGTTLRSGSPATGRVDDVPAGPGAASSDMHAPSRKRAKCLPSGAELGRDVRGGHDRRGRSGSSPTIEWILIGTVAPSGELRAS